jgi:hypothetical protein
MRYKLNVPIRAIVHKAEKTIIADGRGTEMSESGMCLFAGVELSLGCQVEVEFTPPYSGQPIRARGVVRNRDGYRYGVEFIIEDKQAREEVAQLREVLRSLSASA